MPLVQRETEAATTLLRLFANRVTGSDTELKAQAQPILLLVERACAEMEKAVVKLDGYFHELEATPADMRREAAFRAAGCPVFDLQNACGAVAVLLDVIGSHLCDYYEGSREGFLDICGTVGLRSDSSRNLQLAYDVAWNHSQLLIGNTGKPYPMSQEPHTAAA